MRPPTVSSFSLNEVQNMGWRKTCGYCGVTLVETPNDAAQRTREHLTPTSRGGDSGRTNVMDACARCNKDKGNLTVEEYRAVLAVRRESSRQAISAEIRRHITFEFERKAVSA